MAEQINVIDINVIALDTEYSPFVGIEYEIAPGVRAKMKVPTEGLIEQYDAQAQKKNDPRTEKQIAYDQARVVLDVVAGVKCKAKDAGDLSTVPRENLIFAVLDRAADDFLFLSRPKPSKRMRSYMEGIQMLLSAKAESESQPQLLESLPSQSPSSSDGQSAGNSGAAAGPTAASA